MDERTGSSTFAQSGHTALGCGLLYLRGTKLSAKKPANRWWKEVVVLCSISLSLCLLENMHSPVYMIRSWLLSDSDFIHFCLLHSNLGQQWLSTLSKWALCYCVAQSSSPLFKTSFDWFIQLRTSSELRYLHLNHAYKCLGIFLLTWQVSLASWPLIWVEHSIQLWYQLPPRSRR